MSDDSGAGKDGDPESGLPPKAPAYDLRTGEALDAPRAGDHDYPASDFTGTDLGIWAPTRDDAGAEPGIPPQYGPAAYQQTDPPGQPTVARQPTTPPGYGQAAYQQTPPPGYGPDAYQATPPPGYGPAPYQPTSPQQPYGPGGYPPAGTAPTSHQPGPPPPRRRGPAILAGSVGALVVVVAILLGVLLFGNSSKTPVASTSNGTTSGQSGAAVPTAVPQPNQSASTSGGTNSGSTADARVAFLRTVDGILTQSATGRQEVGSVVTGVVNGCSVTPQNASATIRQVIVNRQSVLAQANALSVVDPSTGAVKSNLIQALNDSIEASRGYQRWLDNLYATYFNADPVGCPNGVAPTDSNYDAATAASGRATSAKQSFVAVYNPQASAVGLRTWQESEF